jgi:hypothetical protein
MYQGICVRFGSIGLVLRNLICPTRTPPSPLAGIVPSFCLGRPPDSFSPPTPPAPPLPLYLSNHPESGISSEQKSRFLRLLLLAHPYCVFKAYSLEARERCATKVFRGPLLPDSFSSCSLVSTKTCFVSCTAYVTAHRFRMRQGR